MRRIFRLSVVCAAVAVIFGVGGGAWLYGQPPNKPPYNAIWLEIDKTDSVVYNYPILGVGRMPNAIRSQGDRLTWIAYGHEPISIVLFDSVEQRSDGAYLFRQEGSTIFSFQWVDRKKHIAKWTFWSIGGVTISDKLYIHGLYNTFPVVDFERDELGYEIASGTYEDKPYETTWLQIDETNRVVYNYPLWSVGKMPNIVECNSIREFIWTVYGNGDDRIDMTYIDTVEQRKNGVYFLQLKSKNSFSFQWVDKKKHIARWSEYVDGKLIRSNLYVNASKNTFPVVDFKRNRGNGNEN